MEKTINILGISALYHDSASALIIDGEVVTAVQEEAFTRKKHDSSFPVNAINFCLKSNNITEKDLDAVVFYDNPLLTMDRWINNILELGTDSSNIIERSFDSNFNSRIWINKLIKNRLTDLDENKIYVTKHHISHAASAFYPSPFDSAAILTIDGVGEWTTTSIGIGNKENIKLIKEIRYPHSLGLLYSTFTSFCGFKVNSGEYKLMGLAAYGKPTYYDLIINNIITIKDDGSFKLNLNYFDFYKNNSMFNSELEKLFNIKHRQPESNISEEYINIAASIQKVTEDITLKLVKTAKEITNEKNLVMAGGVALNCVSNGNIQKSKIFDNIWIQPAAGDAGGAIGAALYASYNLFNEKRNICTKTDKQKGSYLGPEYTEKYIQNFLDSKSISYTKYSDKKELYNNIAKEISEGKIIGFFSGKMEFGPRALGARSIIADARISNMQEILNKKIKKRENFRPFAPAILEEFASEYFQIEQKSPYMLFTYELNKNKQIPFDEEKNISKAIKIKKSDIPAVTHYDYSARVQTVTGDSNNNFYQLLNSFYNLTGYPILINTSFNVRGEPIVCSPEDAYNCYIKTEIDILVLENFVIHK